MPCLGRDERGHVLGFFPTPYRSPQLALWELSDTEWLKVVRVPDHAARKQPPPVETQAPLFQLETG